MAALVCFSVGWVRSCENNKGVLSYSLGLGTSHFVAVVLYLESYQKRSLLLLFWL